MKKTTIKSTTLIYSEKQNSLIEQLLVATEPSNHFSFGEKHVIKNGTVSPVIISDYSTSEISSVMLIMTEEGIVTGSMVNGFTLTNLGMIIRDGGGWNNYVKERYRKEELMRIHIESSIKVNESVIKNIRQQYKLAIIAIAIASLSAIGTVAPIVCNVKHQSTAIESDLKVSTSQTTPTLKKLEEIPFPCDSIVE